MHTVAIIQARMSSTRFPGKVLQPLGDHTVLWQVVNRARQIVGVDEVIVATSFADEDRAIVDYCQRNGILVARGGRGIDDVLGRYFDVATGSAADVVVRLTGDCPCLDPNVSSDVLKLLLSDEQCDYATNVCPPSFPDGLDTEALRYSALCKLNESAQLPSEREHPTTYIWSHLEEFQIINLPYVSDYSEMRLTVDTPDDLAFMQELYKALGEEFRLQDVLLLLASNDSLLNINMGHIRNEGLVESKKRDKKK